ncbi:unnamed protein product [Penicillium pancosmium]
MESSIPANAESSPTADTCAKPNFENSTDAALRAAASEDTTSAEIGNRDNVYHAMEQDEIEFQGYSADRSFIQCLNAKLAEWRGGDMVGQQLPRFTSAPAFFEVEYPNDAEVTLPERDLAVRLVEAALDAQILHCIIHQPSFDISFNLIYSLEESEYSAKETRFLPLLYAIFAYGCLVIDPGSYGPGGIDKVSRGRISTCYTYLSATLSIALRMGLHRSLNPNQDLISQELSRRIFWTLRLLVNDIATSIGMPVLLSDDEIDQDFPKETNDIYIEKSRILPQPDGEICYISGANSYKRLQMLRDKVTNCVYSIRGQNHCLENSPFHVVSLASIHGIQKDLEKWVNDIPRGYRLGSFCAEGRLIR